MKKKQLHILFGLLFFFALLQGCENRSASPPDRRMDSTTYLPDTTLRGDQDENGNDYRFGDPPDESDNNNSAERDEEEQTDKPDKYDQYKKVKNLLEFHTRDTMKQDSTYVATLAMGKKNFPG